MERTTAPWGAHTLAILGAGESGQGAALLARRHGYEVFVSEGKAIAPEVQADFTEAGIQFESGTHSAHRLREADLVVKSPGIPPTAPIVAQLLDAGVRIISEIEFAWQHTQGQVIAITGTNGKTTTASLIYHMLSYAGVDVGLGGNIAPSFARALALADHPWWVVEVSSYQLEDVATFRPRLAVITNISEHHLGRYGGSLQGYADTKLRMTACQTPEDFLIYSLDSPVLVEAIHRHAPTSQRLGFSLTQQPDAVAWVDGGQLVVDTDLTLNHYSAMAKDRKKKAPFLLELEQQKLKGKHNQYNTMASAIVGRVLDIRSELVRESLLSFESLEHRLERVRVVGGVEYVNDSKATNVNAAWYALESMSTPVVWIVGGFGKDADYGMLLPLVQQKVKAIVILGHEAAAIRGAFGAYIQQMAQTADMEEAVRMAAKFAGKDDTVLLSPACPSFDLFQNYEERGHRFKSAVSGLEG